MASVRNDDYEVGSLRFLWNSATAAGTGVVGLAASQGHRPHGLGCPDRPNPVSLVGATTAWLVDRRPLIVFSDAETVQPRLRYHRQCTRYP